MQQSCEDGVVNVFTETSNWINDFDLSEVRLGECLPISESDMSASFYEEMGYVQDELYPVNDAGGVNGGLQCDDGKTCPIEGINNDDSMMKHLLLVMKSFLLLIDI